MFTYCMSNKNVIIPGCEKSLAGWFTSSLGEISRFNGFMISATCYQKESLMILLIY